MGPVHEAAACVVPGTPGPVLTHWWVDPVSGVDGYGLGIMDLVGGGWIEPVPDMVECQVWVGPLVDRTGVRHSYGLGPGVPAFRAAVILGLV